MRIHGERVRNVHLARGRALHAPGLDELAVPVELDDARVGVLPVDDAVSVADEDVAIGRDQHRRRRVELVRRVTRNAGLAQRQQHLALRAELEHLMALAVLAEPVGDPDVAFLIREDAMREDEHAGAEGLDQAARHVEVQYRGQIGAGARVRPAALGNPDAGAARINRDAGRGAPAAPFRQVRPVLDRVVRIRQRVERLLRPCHRLADRLAECLGIKRGCADQQCRRQREAESHAANSSVPARIFNSCGMPHSLLPP